MFGAVVVLDSCSPANPLVVHLFQLAVVVRHRFSRGRATIGDGILAYLAVVAYTSSSGRTLRSGLIRSLGSGGGGFPLDRQVSGSGRRELRYPD